MPRPKSKTELLGLSKENFNKLLGLIENMPLEEQQKDFPKGTMNRNIRDILMHLHHWHLMMLDWYKVGMSGQKPDMPSKGYTWRTVPALNRWIWEQYNHVDLEEAKVSFKNSYQELRKVINRHTDEELFEKKRYKWTGTTSLGSYLVSATSSHYDWAIKLIKKAKK